MLRLLFLVGHIKSGEELCDLRLPNSVVVFERRAGSCWGGGVGHEFGEEEFEGSQEATRLGRLGLSNDVPVRSEELNPPTAHAVLHCHDPVLSDPGEENLVHRGEVRRQSGVGRRSMVFRNFNLHFRFIICEIRLLLLPTHCGEEMILHCL